MALPAVTEISTTTTTDGSISLNASNSQSDYPYEHLLPAYGLSEFYPPLEPFEHTDPAARAITLPESEQRAFLRNATRIRNLTPGIGTEIFGVDLTSLDGPARDQLALETGDQSREWGSHFGRLHIHPMAEHPPSIPELNIVYRDGNTVKKAHLSRISTTLWHSDVSYELQPPGITTFFLLAQPSSGGDTLFVSQVLALKKLSPPFVEFLRTLKAVHSSVIETRESRESRRNGSQKSVRRDPVEHVHPVVRKHPVTGEEALYVNQHFTTHVVGLKREESEAILGLLFNHISRVADAQVRVKWEPNTVVIWDNRMTSHTAIFDSAELGERRHGARITPQAERPNLALESLELS
ncbi:hypothetical protein RSOLAG22IIIB_13576 [Rhizoctonia solani]|uniref:TauD/TfdA-like domain-containing protein n=1 Tax=Rhizoctonia solani TaxID=456999 RepID=A0A0K6FPM3_9AGAM|nr:hypothetical protein RSOLAG22IIIB_13576 [Rhizoctonia solani]